MANRGPTVNGNMGGMGFGHMNAGPSKHKNNKQDEILPLEFENDVESDGTEASVTDLLFGGAQQATVVPNQPEMTPEQLEEIRRQEEAERADMERQRQLEEQRQQLLAEEAARRQRISSIFKGDGYIDTDVHLPNAKLEGSHYNFNQIQEPATWGLQKIITESIKQEKIQEMKKAPEPVKKEKTLEEMLEDGEINERTYNKYKAREEKEKAKQSKSKRKNNEVDASLMITNEEWVSQIEAAKKANEDLDAMLKNGEISKKEYKERKKDKMYVIPDPKYPLDKYPKQYFDASDCEIDVKDGKPYYYFNFEKTLRKHNMTFVKKFKGFYNAVEQMAYDNASFDSIAEKQHAKAEKLSNLPALKQYQYDKNLKLKKIGIVAALIIGVFMYITQVLVPAKNFEKAGNYLIRQDYENAYYAFSGLGDYENSNIYTHYCEAQMLYKTGKYEQSEKYFKDLIPYQDFFSSDSFNDSDVKIEDLYKESIYQQGLEAYANKDFDGARQIFKSISSYSQATQYFYKCSYELAEEYASKSDYFNAIDNFYIIAKANYEDSATRMQDIASVLYDNALSSYMIQDYETSIENFAFLAQYKYSNSVDMINQCKYQYALQLFKEKKYTKAGEYFAEISQYKDSVALHKECIYKLATIAYNQDPISSLSLFNDIISYKNTDNILSSDVLFLYGEWNITQINGNKANVDFKFRQNGLFFVDEQLTGVAISTDATPYPYTWDGTQFTSADGAYTISLTISDSNNAVMVCTGNGKSATYTCTRVYDYLDMIAAEESAGEVQTETLTINQRYEKELGEYIDKKTDGVATINNQEVDVNGKETQMQENLNNISLDGEDGSQLITSESTTDTETQVD